MSFHGFMSQEELAYAYQTEKEEEERREKER